jgi:integrase
MSIRKLPDGRYEWRHRVGGRHLKKTFARRADAVSHDAAVRADAARGVLVDLGNKTTVAQFARAWSQSRVLRPESRRIHESWLRNHVEGTAIGGRPVVKVRPSEVQSWIKGRSAVLGPVSLAKCVVMLRAVFSAAVADGVCARNPVQPGPRLALPPAERVKFVPLTVSQVRAWAAHAPGRVRAMIVTQAALGLRISELRGLRVPDVDFLRREVHIGSQLDPAGRRAPLKTARSRRIVPLPAVAADALAAHLAEFGAGRDGLIFTGARGGPWAASRPLWTAYHAAAVAAGLPDGTSSHDLRHHYASVLLAAGESIHVVAERLGDTPALVLDTYGHVMPDQEDRTRTAVDAAWAGAQERAAGGSG